MKAKIKKEHNKEPLNFVINESGLDYEEIRKSDLKKLRAFEQFCIAYSDREEVNIVFIKKYIRQKKQLRICKFLLIIM